MKRTALILAGALLAAPFAVSPQETPRPKVESFLEGLCVGLVIGLTVDALIIIGVQCYRNSTSTNAPPVQPPPPQPPTTNAPPITNALSSAVLRSGGSGATWFTNGAFQTVLQTQTGPGSWSALYTFTGWPQANGAWCILVQDSNGVPVLTNDGPALQPLALTLPTNTPQRFYKLSAP